MLHIDVMIKCNMLTAGQNKNSIYAPVLQTQRNRDMKSETETAKKLLHDQTDNQELDHLRLTEHSQVHSQVE